MGSIKYFSAGVFLSMLSMPLFSSAQKSASSTPDPSYIVADSISEITDNQPAIVPSHSGLTTMTTDTSYKNWEGLLNIASDTIGTRKTQDTVGFKENRTPGTAIKSDD